MPPRLTCVAAAVAQVVLLAAVPMLACGLGPGLARAAGLLLLALLGIAAGAETLAVGARVETEPVPPLARASALALLAGFWLALTEGSLRAAPTHAVPGLLGGAALLSGVALRVAAIRTLGDDFVSTHRAGALVTGGVYRVLRHPSETGQLLLALGAALLAQSGASALWLAAVILPLTLLRLRREERALLRHAPAYAAYRARVGGLLPRLQ